KAANRITETIRQRTEIAEYLLRKEPWDLFAVVFSESDTAAHHFWAAHDENSPRHTIFRKTYGDELKDFLKSVYVDLDTSVGRLIETAKTLNSGKNGPKKEPRVMIVSDHGSGGTGDTLLSLNRILEKAGLFRYTRSSMKIADSVSAKTAADSTGFLKTAARILPAKTGQWLFRHGPEWLPKRLESKNRLRHANLLKCQAFSDELNYFPSIWINDQRFPGGQAINSTERDELCDKIRQILLAETNPATGQPIICNVYRREEIYSGPALDIIPDLIVEPALDRGYSYAIWNAPESGPVLENLPQRELRGRKGGSMNGSHRQYGVLLTNEKPTKKFPFEPDIIDAGRLLMQWFGLDKSTEILNGNQQVYTPQQARELEKRLKDLGYLD
ncbi:alkaline phosphatase family protein, partial [bacterium]|nr:alkaline phosphatase family protein [bacterium]